VRYSSNPAHGRQLITLPFSTHALRAWQIPNFTPSGTSALVVFELGVIQAYALLMRRDELLHLRLALCVEV
jgi:hypothetical protein